MCSFRLKRSKAGCGLPPRPGKASNHGTAYMEVKEKAMVFVLDCSWTIRNVHWIGVAELSNGKGVKKQE